MRCPKCGCDQPEALECARCGVVVARWRAGERPKPVRASSPLGPSPRRGSSAVGLALLGLGVLAAFGVGARFFRELPPASVPTSRTEAGMAEQRPADSVALRVDIPAERFPSPPPLATAREAPAPESCPLASGRGAWVASRSPVSSYWQEGARGFADAGREQARVKAPLLVYFYTDWCPYCRELDRTVLSDSSFDRFRAVKVRVNPEAGPEERAIADRFGVNGYPSLFLIASPSVSPQPMSLGTREQDGPFRFLTVAEILQGFEDERTRAVAGLVLLGHDRREGGDVAGAIQALDEAVGMEPERAEAWLQRGLARHESGDTEGAYEDYRAALSLQRGYFDVYARVAFDLGQKGKWDEAAACWTAFLQEGPRDGKALLERSRAHAHRGDRRRAREDAEEACRLGDSGACGVATSLKG